MKNKKLIKKFIPMVMFGSMVVSSFPLHVFAIGGINQVEKGSVETAIDDLYDRIFKENEVMSEDLKNEIARVNGLIQSANSTEYINYTLKYMHERLMRDQENKEILAYNRSNLGKISLRKFCIHGDKYEEYRERNMQHREYNSKIEAINERISMMMDIVVDNSEE